MASIVQDKRRGTWAVQWWNGVKWDRKVVLRKRPGWKPGDPMPRKAPVEVQAALTEYLKLERVARTRKGYNPRVGVEEFLAAFVENYDIGHTVGSKGQLRQAVGVFVAWCHANNVRRLEDVTAEVCHQWVEARAGTKAKRSGKPITHATLKKEKALLATAWSEGLAKGRVAANPWVGIETPGTPARQRRGSWSPEEVERLMAVSHAWLRDVLTIGCHTGLRIAALRGIEWRDIHWNRDPARRDFGVVEVRPELDKAGKGYRVPIHPKVHDVLTRRFIHRPPGVESVLTGRQGRPMRRSNVTDRAILSACKRAGLKRPDSPNHHMRRTFGRWAVLGHLTGKPVPIYVVSRWMGHSSVKVTESYLDLRHDDSTSYMMGEEGTGRECERM